MMSEEEWGMKTPLHAYIAKWHAWHARHLCLKRSFFHLQEEKQYEMCFCHFPGNLLHCLFSGRQVCIFSAAWDPGRGGRAHVPEKRLLIKPACARIELKCYHDEILDIHFLTLW